MTLYREIAIAIAFGRNADQRPLRRLWTAEELAEQAGAYDRYQEEQDRLRDQFLRKDSKPEDFCDSVQEVVLRPDEVLAAQHAMALHLSSTSERVAAESADYVTVKADGNGGALVSFLKRKPTPVQATDDNAG